MKVKIGRSQRDRKSAVGNYSALHKFSEKTAKEKLKEKPLQRQGHTKVTVKLNSSGNLRGMHNADNPPDSDRMRRIRAMRRMYNKQMPQLQCSSCQFSQQCPQYRAGYVCAFIPFLNSHKVETVTDLIEAMKEVCGASMRRVHLMTMFETLSGQKPGFETTEALASSFEQLRRLHETIVEGGELTVETDDDSIIGKLFGGIGNLMESTRQAQENPVEVPLLQVADVPESIPVFAEKSEVDLDLVKEHSREELEQGTGKVKATPTVTMSELK